MSPSRVEGPVVVLACCAAIFWIGTLVFGFPGVMAGYWREAFDASRADIGRILFFVLAAVGVSMFVVGKLQESLGPARLVAAGSVAGALATVLLPMATSIAGVYLWAFVTGASSALIYLPGLTVVQRWYPLRRGLVSGLFNLFFGGSAALASPLYGFLLRDFGYGTLVGTAAAMTLVFGLAAAPLVRFPPGRAAPPASGKTGMPVPPISLTVSQSLRTQSFWLLWCTWALGGAGGVSMVLLSVSFGLSRGLDAGRAVLLLTAFNLTNGLSRLISGYVSDRIGRKWTLATVFILAAAAYFLLDRVEGLGAWMALIAVIGFALGSMFAVSAPLASDCFGLDHFGAIFGLVFTAYGFVAGVLGPWLSGVVLDATGGDYRWVFTYLGSFYLVSAILILKTTPQSECVLPDPQAG